MDKYMPTQVHRGVVLALLTLLPFATPGAPEDAPRAEAVAKQLITPLHSARFAQDDDVKCLKSALENGNPDTGPSTFLLKAPTGCHIRPHYHTAEEQLIVIRGSVWTAMRGMHGTLLTAGGVAVMPGNAVHWFSCRGTRRCLMAVTFDKRYDIVWADQDLPKTQ
jgi:quercetin dioxygenase-like cupin family protein